jgi:hypothetical protein
MHLSGLRGHGSFQVPWPCHKHSSSHSPAVLQPQCLAQLLARGQRRAGGCRDKRSAHIDLSSQSPRRGKELNLKVNSSRYMPESTAGHKALLE